MSSVIERDTPPVLRSSGQPSIESPSALPSWALVISTYNRKDVLLRCINTALTQTVPPAEVIVVDASADWEANREQVERAVAPSHPRVKFEYREARQKRLPAQRNQGIELATADVLFMIDDDSLMYPDCAEEILRVLPEVDVFVAGLGTGGTLMGCARRLRRDRPDVQIVAAEPLPGEGIDGLRSLEDGYTPEIIDLSLLDRKLLVSNEESVRGLRALVREEGLFAGVSSGGVVHAAMRVARELDGPANIVMVLADGGWKYLSAGLWDTPEDELAERMEQGIWW